VLIQPVAQVFNLCLHRRDACATMIFLVLKNRRFMSGCFFRLPGSRLGISGEREALHGSEAETMERRAEPDLRGFSCFAGEPKDHEQLP
jgi:hypothetical protein